MTAGRWLLAGVLGAGALGCAGPAPDEPLAAQTQNIVDGEASGSDQDGVVLLRAVLADQSEIVCSASLVGPNLILTARHCVSYFTDGQFSCSARGELIDNPTGAGMLGLHLPAASLAVYGRKMPRKAPLAHGQQVISTLSPSICENDLAFVVLDTALDLPIIPLRLGRPALVHEAGVLVGFGLDATQTGIDYSTQPRKQKRDLQIMAVGPDSIADGVTTVPPRMLILEGPSGCIGDSGGPLLSEASGALLGVYSLQDGESCAAPDVRHQMVHVPAFQTLIDQAFSAAGCTPEREPEPDAAAGAAGAAGAATAVASSAGAAPQDTATSGGAGGADSDPASEPEPQPPTPQSSSCAFTAPQQASASLTQLLMALGLAVVVTMRRSDRARRRRAA